jgi:hypothetical protein
VIRSLERLGVRHKQPVDVMNYLPLVGKAAGESLAAIQRDNQAEGLEETIVSISSIVITVIRLEVRA